MMQTGCWARRIVDEAKPEFTVRMVPLLHNVRHAQTSQPQTWQLTAQSQTRGTQDAGWEVIQWMSNTENQTALAHGDWLFPTRQSAMADPRFNAPENDWQLAVSEIPYAKPYPKHPAWSEFEERVFGPGVQRYLMNEQSLDDLITTSVDEGTKLIAKYQPKS